MANSNQSTATQTGSDATDKNKDQANKGSSEQANKGSSDNKSGEQSKVAGAKA